MKRVLVIDDTKNIRNLLSTCLEIRGYNVITADNGVEALRIIKNKDVKINLIFLDIRMPGISGTELLKNIKEERENCPVIIMTAFATVKNAIECTKLGALVYLQKPVSIDWAAGGSGAADYGSIKNISISMVVLIGTLLLNRYGKGMLSSASILIGMVIGYIVCIPLGLVDFTAVKEASWISMPKIFEYGVTFDLKALIAFIPAYFVTAIETVGCLKAVGEVSEVEMTEKRIGAGVLSDGIGSMIGGVVGTLPNTTFSQNVGLIPLTKVASRYVAVMAGVILVILGFLPKLAAIVNSIPQPVLGGVGIVMFGTVAAAGIKTLSKVKINERNLLIIATSIGLGLGVTFRPEFIAQLPEGLKMIFASGISTGTITALILNIILKEETA